MRKTKREGNNEQKRTRTRKMEEIQWNNKQRREGGEKEEGRKGKVKRDGVVGRRGTVKRLRNHSPAGPPEGPELLIQSMLSHVTCWRG